MIDIAKAAQLIAEFEGFVDHVYDDGFGNETIGYGETSAAILKKYRRTGISQPEAFALLLERVAEFYNDISQAITREPTVNQAVAYTSLAFNIGVGGFKESTTLKRHNAGDTAGAAEAILWWNKVDGAVVEGLARRRQREHDLYLAGQKPEPVPLPSAALATVKLVSLNSALSIDVAAESHDNGASIIQWPAHDRWNQEWSLVPIPDGNPGEVAIVAGHSGKVMDVAMWSTEDGARVQQWDYHGGANQRWRVLSTGNVLQFQNVHSGKLLDVRGLSIDAGADLIQWAPTGGLNQMFMRVRMERTSTLNPVTGPAAPPHPADVPPPVDPGFDVGDALRRLGGFPNGDDEDVYGFQAGFSFWDLSIDGDAGPETVKAIRYSLENGGRCGKYFTFAEFGCKHCGRCRISAFHVRQLDQYRERVGPVSIISGTRCDEHNAAVGGATNSQHRPYPNNRGMSMASDIPGATTVGELRGLRLFSGIGYVPSEGNVVVHVDSRGAGENNTTGGSLEAPTTWQY